MQGYSWQAAGEKQMGKYNTLRKALSGHFSTNPTRPRSSEGKAPIEMTKYFGTYRVVCDCILTDTSYDHFLQYAKWKEHAFIGKNHFLPVSERTLFPPLTMMQRYLSTPFSFIRLLFDLLQILLFARFVFILLGANAANQFVLFLYNVTSPFVGTFRTIFASSIIQGFTIEWGTVIAMVTYAIVAILLMRLLDMIVKLAEGPLPDDQIHHHHV